MLLYKLFGFNINIKTERLKLNIYKIFRIFILVNLLHLK